MKLSTHFILFLSFIAAGNTCSLRVAAHNNGCVEEEHDSQAMPELLGVYGTFEVLARLLYL